jgi:aryl-alcohol dehydrogenase-like predicted oxidoreductase
VTLQPQYSLPEPEIESEIVPACVDANVGLLPWSPLAGGWLTGMYQRDARRHRDALLQRAAQGLSKDHSSKPRIRWNR